jgi:hypothetical protein
MIGSPQTNNADLAATDGHQLGLRTTLSAYVLDAAKPGDTPLEEMMALPSALTNRTLETSVWGPPS